MISESISKTNMQYESLKYEILKMKEKFTEWSLIKIIKGKICLDCLIHFPFNNWNFYKLRYPLWAFFESLVKS